jgi:predicted negative regulator of RcsB-dependent stress response
VAKIERTFTDMKDKFGSTTYAQQAGLLAAKHLQDKGNADAAKAALTWVADKSSDESYQAIAKLRLAALLIQAKSWDAAAKQLDAKFPAAFAGLVADRRGDILLAQDKKAEARAEYEKAYKALDERAEYRRLVEVKLTSLGADPKAGVTAASVATSEPKK